MGFLLLLDPHGDHAADVELRFSPGELCRMIATKDAPTWTFTPVKSKQTRIQLESETQQRVREN